MEKKVDRRMFLRNTGFAGLAAGLGREVKPLMALAAETSKEKGDTAVTFKKAIITNPPNEAIMTELKAAGFDGLEANLWSSRSGDWSSFSREEAAKVRKHAEKIGFRVHSVLSGWARFNDPDPAVVKADREFTVATMRAAQGYGADEILLVPGRVGDNLKMPARDRFRVKFDRATGHMTETAEGDNTPYKDYIDAHNRAWDAFHESVSELIPVADETGVVVAIENVWNNMFLSPEYFAFFIDSFKSKWIRAYFDVANHVVYGPPPQDWIRVLGKRICKVHIKDYKLNPPDGNEWPSLREGSVEFPKVMVALKEVGYDGWLTIEGPCGDHKECSRRLDLIIQGV